MKYAELHYFADLRFVSAAGGSSLFVWGVYEISDNMPLPQYVEGFGIAIDVTGMETPPAIYATYDPIAGTFGPPLPSEVPALQPFWTAMWDNSNLDWKIAPA